MIEINEKNLTMLARTFAPVLRFHPSERFFPLLVESWLTTTSTGVWPEAAHEPVRLQHDDLDPGRHGAAVCTADALMTALRTLIGPPLDGDRPISLAPDPDDPYSLLSDVVAAVGEKAFLDVGGWADPQLSQGNLEYLADLCSELASAMNPTLAWSPAVDRSQVPWSWITQPPHPTMYCEVTWAGSYPRLAEAAGAPEFPPDERSFDHMVAFTYHVFYGARTPAAPGAEGRTSEGQWEAITLYFRGELARATGAPNVAGRPVISYGHIAEAPWAVVISQCQDRAAGTHWTAARAYSDCEKVADAPVIYVARGTHRNYFEPVSGQTYDPAEHGPHAPDPTIHVDESDSWIGVDGFLAGAGASALVGLAALIAAGLLSGVGAVVAAVLAVLLILLALVLLIMWLVSACDEASDEDAGEHLDFGGDPDEASSVGPQAGGDGSENAAGAAPGGGPDPGAVPGAGGTVGLPNTGSPTGRSTAFPDIRIIERLLVNGAGNSRTTFPSVSVLENPSWWDFRGRWGIRVRPAPTGGTWESGWRRVDDQGRDWGYFNTERLLLWMNNGRAQS